MEIVKRYCEEISKGESGELELEIRAKLEKERFVELLNKFSDNGKKGSLELSINFLGAQHLVQQLIFEGTTRKSEKLYRKIRLMEPYYSNAPKYSLVLSREVATTEKPGDNVEMVRIRARWIIVGGGSGTSLQYHFTLTQNYPADSITNLKPFKDKLFARINNYQGFLHSINDGAGANANGWTGFEFETEVMPPKSCDPEKILAAVSDVLSGVFDGATANFQYQEYIGKLAEVLYGGPGGSHDRVAKFKSGALGLKGLGKSVISVTKSNWNTVHSDLGNFYMGEKIDGERTLIWVEGDTAAFISSELIQMKLPKSYPRYILEGEQTEHRFYIYDVWVWNGENILERPFAERIARAASEESSAVELLKKLSAVEKPFRRLENAEMIKTFWKESEAGKFSKDEKKDGIIFVKNAEYEKMQTFKWKPVELLTIDFLARKPPQRVLGIAPYVTKPGKTLYWLFCGISREQYMRKGLSFLADYDIMFPGLRKLEYFPIQFSPPDAPLAYLFYAPTSAGELDEKVVELGWDSSGDGGNWTLHRIREDREVEVKRQTWFGNDFTRVAEPNWDAIHDPISVDWLVSPDFGYFNKEKSEVYMAQTAYNSFVKNYNIQTYLHLLRQSAHYKERPFHNFVIDLAAGKGQDLFRLESAGVKEALFVDIDAQALKELRRRVQTSEKPLRMKIWTKAADLTGPAEDNIKAFRGDFGLPEEGVDLIICNFAIHYLVGDMANLVELIAGLLRPGGVFLFSCFDGKRLGDLLDQNGGTIVWGEGDVVEKYKISRTTTGRIAVKLPFSDEPYEEMLVNIDDLVEVFKKVGFKPELRHSFGHLFGVYEAQAKARKLSEVDKKYVDLYSYVALYRE